MTSDAQRVCQWKGKFIQVFQQGRWEYVDRIQCTGAAVIVAVTDDRKLILIEQFRVPMNQRVIELPAGIAGDTEAFAGEELATAAKRELLEETGYEASRITQVASGPTSPGLATETATFFLATGLRKLNDGGGDEHEEIDVHLVPLDEVEQWLSTRGEVLIDPKIFSGLYFVLKRGL